MAVYKCKIKGQKEIRAIKMPSAAAARAAMVDASPMSADEVADFVADGGVIETVEGKQKPDESE